MQGHITTEEFQRYQEQLLDLRETQLQTNEAKLRAERRVQQLESELTSKSDALKEAQFRLSLVPIDILARENSALREKLLSLESSFKLQTATLRAECHRLGAENAKLQSLTEKSSVAHLDDTSTQTGLNYSVTDASVQVSESESVGDGSTANEAIVLSKVISPVDTEILMLRKELEDEKSAHVESKKNLSEQCHDASVKIERLEEELRIAIETTKELKNEVVSVTRRSEKIQRDLRRQVAQLLRTTQNAASDHGSLSIFPSGNNLAEMKENGLDCQSVSSVTAYTLSKSSDGDDTSVHSFSSNAQTLEPRSGFYPESDFKALVNRLSEVQEDNCVLRRLVRTLESEVAAKSHALQRGLTEKLAQDDAAAAGDAGVLSRLRSFTFSSGSTSASLSSVNLKTVNRLKLLCEELITRNMALEDSLKHVQQTVNSKSK